MTAAVFLDRDGVINRNAVRDDRPVAPTTLDAFEFLPGVEDAVAALRVAGFRIVVATNQPDVGKGVVDKTVVEAMHDRLRSRLAVDAIKVCYHVDDDGCDCRKPKPGMLLEAAREWRLDLGRSYMVGDRWRDVEAGRNAGCRTIFIDHHYAERRPAAPDFTVASLAEAASLILSSPDIGRTHS